jgi:hypothetical protein
MKQFMKYLKFHEILDVDVSKTYVTMELMKTCKGKYHGSTIGNNLKTSKK